MFILLFALFTAARAQTLTPLDEYVRRPDDTFRFTLLANETRPGENIFYINMTSQTWRWENETTTPVWWHHLVIVVPTTYDRDLDTGLLFLGAGSSTDAYPNPDTDPKFVQVRNFAVRTGTVAAYLRQIPNQPLNFVQAGMLLSESAALAYCKRRFMANTADPEILLEMPMTKAAHRAMDTVTEFMRSLGHGVNRYMITGGGKRGKIAWLATATDPVGGRVFSLVPKSYSMLNIVENLHHHFRSLNGWSFATWDYYFQNMTQYLDTPNFQLMANILDAYNYRSRLTMPKLYIAGASDELFLLDDSHYWLDQIPAPMYMLMLENTGHSTSNSPKFNDMWHAIRNFYLHTATGASLPTVTWMRNETLLAGSITVQTSQVPANVSGWYADSNFNMNLNSLRDFRLETLAATPNIQWEYIEVENLGGNTYYLEIDMPDHIGWIAFFIEVEFAGVRGNNREDRLVFTSEANIIPDEMAAARCNSPAQCWGTLV